MAWLRELRFGKKVVHLLHRNALSQRLQVRAFCTPSIIMNKTTESTWGHLHISDAVMFDVSFKIGNSFPSNDWKKIFQPTNSFNEFVGYLLNISTISVIYVLITVGQSNFSDLGNRRKKLAQEVRNLPRKRPEDFCPKFHVRKKKVRSFSSWSTCKKLAENYP